MNGGVMNGHANVGLKYPRGFNTKNLNSEVPAKMASPKNLDELFAEMKQYKMLKKKDMLHSNESPGTPAYLVKIEWLQKYHNFLGLKDFEKDILKD